MSTRSTVIKAVLRAEQYTHLQLLSGFKPGDWVRVTRRAKCYEKGWMNSWISPEMDRFVRKKFKILDDGGSIGFKLQHKNMTMGLYFPYFILEKTTPPRKNTL